jgi:hypothetical protein
MKRWLSAIVVGGLLALAVAAVAIAAPSGGKWRGTNNQVPAQSLTFQVSKNGKQVLNFQPAFIVKCTTPGKPKKSVGITSDAKTNIPIRNNAFALKGSHAQIHNGPSVYGSGTESIAGTFPHKRSALGTYTLTFTFNKSAPKGLAGYHCRTGKVHWTATHT